MNEKVKKIVKWIAVIAAAIGAAAAVIMEQGCTHKHFLKANGIKIDTIEVSTELIRIANDLEDEKRLRELARALAERRYPDEKDPVKFQNHVDDIYNHFLAEAKRLKEIPKEEAIKEIVRPPVS